MVCGQGAFCLDVVICQDLNIIFHVLPDFKRIQDFQTQV